MFQNLYDLDRDMMQPLGRVIQEAFSDGFRANGEDGIWKFHARPTTQGRIVELKSYFTPTTGIHWGLDATVDYKPGGNDVADAADGSAGIRALGGIARLAPGYTMVGGSIIGLYGQFKNNGTINGGQAFPSAIYGLIQDGGVYTKVSHLSALWLDSHLTKSVTGQTEFLYISNNGSTVFDQAIFIYGNDGKITNLFRIETPGDMVSGGIASSDTAAKKLKINLEGTTYYVNARKS